MAPRKSSTPKAPATPRAKRAPAAPAEASEEVLGAVAAEAKVLPPELKKKELIARVTEALGARKGGVKEVVEATLLAMGAALSKGESLNLPPFGKARVNRKRDVPGGEMLVLKLRRGEAGPKVAGVQNEATEPLAATDD